MRGQNDRGFAICKQLRLLPADGQCIRIQDQRARRSSKQFFYNPAGAFPLSQSGADGTGGGCVQIRQDPVQCSGAERPGTICF